MTNQFIAVELDGVLATHLGRSIDLEVIGTPIAQVLKAVKELLANDWAVKIMTDRITCDNPAEAQFAKSIINEWQEEHIGQRLDIINTFDKGMIDLWTHRALCVLPNWGVSQKIFFSRKKDKKSWKIKCLLADNETMKYYHPSPDIFTKELNPFTPGKGRPKDS